MVSPLLVCACPLPVDRLRADLCRAFLSTHAFFEIVGDDGEPSSGTGVFPRSNGTSISPLANGSFSGVSTRSTAIASDSMLVRRLDDMP